LNNTEHIEAKNTGGDNPNARQ